MTAMAAACSPAAPVVARRRPSSRALALALAVAVFVAGHGLFVGLAVVLAGTH
jgi:hypothetical protein